MILLYRCWIIWGRRWLVVVVPGFLALVSLGGGLALAGLGNSPLWGTDREKVILLFRVTGITAYSISLSILVASQEARPVLGFNLHRSLRTTIVMMIESGVLMFALQLVVVLLFAREAFAVISSPMIQIFGIAPTLLCIRVVMGSAYGKTTRAQGESDHSGRTSTQTTSPCMSAAGVQSWGTNTRFSDTSNNEGAADNTV
ncbi:hypothetical protein BD779DRAFT_1532088 [Infundibulicybe gibba]|nr:hypothetical protein BD779DRAFT_1532088 [Infundibulicybe gibba]